MITALPAHAESIEAFGERFGAGYRWYITVTVMLGTIATILTSTIINVALPNIMGAFGMGQDHVQLLVTGFLGAMTATMLANSWMVDSFGQRNSFTAALLVFLLASIMGGLAPNEGVLILARVLQGASAGILQPLAMLAIFEAFPPNRRGTAMGIYGVGVVVAPALGPTLGGIMVDHFSWREVFFLPVPFGLLGLFLSRIFLRGRSSREPLRPFDWPGMCMLSIFLFALLYGLTNGPSQGWLSGPVMLAFALVLAAFVGFLLWELHSAAPLIDVRLFVNPTFASASVLAFIFGAGIFGSTYIIPLFVLSIQGYTATRAGLVLMPGGLILAIMFPLAGRLTDGLPVRVPVVFGLCVFAYSFYLMRFADADTSFFDMAWWIILGRIGLSFIMPGLNAGALQALPVHLLAQGSGAINFVRQFGGAVGVNLLAMTLESRTSFYTQALAAAQNPANSSTIELLRGVRDLLARMGVPEAVQQAGALNYLGRVVYAQGHMLAYRDGFVILGATFIISLIPALLMRDSKPR
ncbi:DHA2 family efflux MFS transporter permease subunit [Piscinibacter sakaiensis]|uniref:DHA2 family efflux MFS transporter permease subunit n=1 Tax=Piscinibacter sakaiensis TaxID=1547922 RepID=UPI003AAFD46E